MSFSLKLSDFDLHSAKGHPLLTSVIADVDENDVSSAKLVAAAAIALHKLPSYSANGSDMQEQPPTVALRDHIWYLKVNNLDAASAMDVLFDCLNGSAARVARIAVKEANATLGTVLGAIHQEFSRHRPLSRLFAIRQQLSDSLDSFVLEVDVQWACLRVFDLETSPLFGKAFLECLRPEFAHIVKKALRTQEVDEKKWLYPMVRTTVLALQEDWLAVQSRGQEADQMLLAREAVFNMAERSHEVDEAEPPARHRRLIECFRCAHVGHIASECDAKEKFCSQCGADNHVRSGHQAYQLRMKARKDVRRYKKKKGRETPTEAVMMMRELPTGVQSYSSIPVAPVYGDCVPMAPPPDPFDVVPAVAETKREEDSRVDQTFMASTSSAHPDAGGPLSFIELVLFGKTVNCLVDTGSSRNVISESALRRVLGGEPSVVAPTLLHRVANPLMVATVNGVMEWSSFARLTLYSVEAEIVCPSGSFFVVKTDAFDVLLGAPFLKNSTLDFVGRVCRVLIGDKNVSMPLLCPRDRCDSNLSCFSHVEASMLPTRDATLLLNGDPLVADGRDAGPGTDTSTLAVTS